MNNSLLARITPLLVALFVPFDAAHGLELGAPFADHAVLQRERPAPVWGWSRPGTSVTVEFAGQKKNATAAGNGKWSVTLDPLPASAEPREMTIVESGGESRTLKDLLVGEVWMASGQSNMQWIASKSSVQHLIASLKAKGETPPIREFEVTSVYAALHPIERATGEWKVNDYGNQSAIAFAFALEIHKATGVPVGILNCSFSQTSIESWVPREGFAEGKDEYTRSIHRKLLQTDPATPEHKAAWDAFYLSLEDTLTANARQVAALDPRAGERDMIVGVLPLFHVFANVSVLNRTVINGGCIAMLPRFDAGQALKTLQRVRAAAFPGVPTMYQALLDHPRAAKTDFSTLRICISGGAPLPLPLKQRFTYAQAPVDTRTATLVQDYLEWAWQHARHGSVRNPAFLQGVDGYSKLERMEQALRACTLWLWLSLRFPGVYGHEDDVLALRSTLNDGIERQLKGHRPLAQMRRSRSGPRRGRP